MRSYRLAVIVGSNRKESINRKLAVAMTRLLPDNILASFPQIDDLPLYNMDLEVDRPQVVHRFTAEIAAADAVMFAMPEHNRSIPAVLKNAIDWGSKPMDKNVWRNKPTLIAGTSPGAMGAAIGQQHLRQIMSGVLGAHVLGGEIYVQFKPELIDQNGDIAIADTKAFLQGHMDRFADLIAKLA